MIGRREETRRNIRRVVIAMAGMGALCLQGCAAQRLDGPRALINLQDKCAGSPVVTAAIRFTASPNGELCPTAATAPGGNNCVENAKPILSAVGAEISDVDVVCARRGQLVRWIAIDADNNPIGVKYDIYFDPFVGRTLHSNDQGCAKAIVDLAAPKVAYKYSIVKQSSDCPPFDPKFVVQP